MQGFEEASVLISTDGLGYKVEQKIEHKTVDISDPSLDIETIRAERRRREIAALSTKRSEAMGDGTFAGEEQFVDGGEGGEQAAPKRILSLRDQLAANKEAAEAAWQEKHNKIRAPAGLSEEDYNEMIALEESKYTKHQQQKEQERRDYEEYAAALSAATGSGAVAASSSSASSTAASAPEKVDLAQVDIIDPSLSFSKLKSTTAGAAAASLLSPEPVSAASSLDPSASSSSSSSALPLVVLKRKHSHEKKDGSEKKEKKHKKQKKEKNESASSTTDSAAAASEPTALAGLMAYSSDEE